MRRLLAASGLLFGALSLAACGGGGSSAGTTPAASSVPPTSADTALVAYDDCLTQHGVDPSTVRAGGGFAGGAADGSRPTGGSQPNGSRTGSRPANLGSIPGGGANAQGSRTPRGTLDATDQAARDACQSLLPQGAGPGGGAAVDVQAFRLYQSCLADNGVPVSTAPPSSVAPGGPGGGFGGLAGIDRSSPAFAAADAKCRVLLPANAQGLGGAGATSTTPTTSR